jgi:uncharacterized protein (TIGR02391 family)
MALDKIFPPADQLIELEPEELGALVLRFLNANTATKWNLYNFVTSYAMNEPPDVKDALVAGWIWLEREGLLLPDLSDATRDFVRISRRGYQLLRDNSFKEYRLGTLLPARVLDGVLAEKVVHLFLRGDYDTAVFQAFKEVEIRVRAASKSSGQKLGTDLMREAFDAKRGSLTDHSLSVAEREAWAHVFAGAIGLFKNPMSHRDVDLGPQEAAELIFLANYLLRVVDLRSVDGPVPLQRRSKPSS